MQWYLPGTSCTGSTGGTDTPVRRKELLHVGETLHTEWKASAEVDTVR